MVAVTSLIKIFISFPVISSVPSRLFGIQNSVNPQPHFHLTHLERKQDLMSTNQNTRLTTRRHPTSCILVPRHECTHDNHPRRLKSPINSIFAILDSFYHHHFAFPSAFSQHHIVMADPMSKDAFLPPNIRQIHQAGCTRPST